ncbi:MAG: hypothetical protein ACREMV_11790 [Gemmatimonadales bacterium]
MTSHLKVVISYAGWATICAAVAGAAVVLVHVAFFRQLPWPLAFVAGGATPIVIAAGQGVVAVIVGGVLAALGRTLRLTLLLGLLIGLVDLVLYLVHTHVPATQLGPTADLAVFAAAAAVITLLGNAPTTAPT